MTKNVRCSSLPGTIGDFCELVELSFGASPEHDVHKFLVTYFREGGGFVRNVPELCWKVCLAISEMSLRTNYLLDLWNVSPLTSNP